MGLIIGISGKIGSGKSTVTKFLIDNMQEFNFVEKSFAYNVKAIASIISGLPIEVAMSQEGKNRELPLYGNMTVGKLLQVIGTDLFRDHFDDMVWVKSLFAPYDAAKDNWIVSDVRFKNEADYVKRMGGILVRLEGDPAGVRAKSTRDLDHPSETDLDDYCGFNIVMHTEAGDAGTDKMHRLVRYVHELAYDKQNGKPEPVTLHGF